MLIPSEFAQVNLIFGGPGIPLGAQMTFGVANPEDLDPYGIATLVDAAYNDAEVYDSQSVQARLTGILVKKGPNATGASALLGVDRQGTAAGACIPPNTAVLVGKTTDFGGRRGRGRMYFPCVAESNVEDDGTLASAFLTSTQTRFGAFRNELVSVLLPPFLLHSEGDSSIPAPYEINGFVVSSKVATQRRRLRR